MNQLLDRLFAHAVTVIAFTVGLFHLLDVSGLFVLSTREVRVFHLLMMLALLFLTTATLKRLESSLADKLFRLVLVVISTACCVSILTRWKEIAFSGGAGSIRGYGRKWLLYSP